MTQQTLEVAAEEWILLLVVASSCVINRLPVASSERTPLEVITEKQQKVFKVLWHRKIFMVIVKHTCVQILMSLDTLVQSNAS